MNKDEFNTHLAAQTYDKLYQDIKPLGFVGYSKSHQTWAVLQTIIDWKGLSVIDLGCFHGYFCFRAEQAGAIKTVGLDLAEVVLVTARKIAELEGSAVTTFQQWDDTQPIPPGDVTLCLNALHHFSKPLECLQHIRSEQAIFEVKVEQVDMISSVFDITSQRPSRRKGRVILLGRKKAVK